MDGLHAPNASYRAYNGSPLVRDFVIRAYWNQLQPTGTNELVTTAIDSGLAEAQAQGAQVRLRVFAGQYAPDWVKNSAGSMPWEEPTNGTTFTVPRFWRPEVRDAWNNLMTKLSQKYDGNANLAEVTISRCMTTFAEPFMRQSSSAADKTAAINAGYTFDLDVNCLKESVDIFKTTWPTTRATLAANPFQGFNPPAGQGSTTTTIAIMQYCREQLGSRCVLGNNSLRSTSLGSKYDEMYAELKRLGPPIYLQTATPQNIGDWVATLDFADSLGANSVELNAGYTSYDKAVLADKNTALLANTYPTDPSQPPSPTPTPVPTPTPAPSPTPSTPPATTSNSQSSTNPTNTAVSAQTPSTGTIQLAAPGTKAVVKIDGKPVSKDGTIDTKYLPNGTHTVTVINPDGTTSTKTITVNNQQNPWQLLRNKLFVVTHGNRLLANSLAVAIPTVSVSAPVLLLFRFRLALLALFH